MAEATTLETLAATTTISPDAATVVSRQQDLPDEGAKEKVDEVQNATRKEEEDLQAEPSQIREVIVDPPEVAISLPSFGSLPENTFGLLKTLVQKFLLGNLIVVGLQAIKVILKQIC